MREVFNSIKERIDPEKRRKFLFVYLPLTILIAISGLIIGLFMMDWVIMPLIVGKHRGNTIVPNIVKMSTLDAYEAIKKADLKLEKEKEEFSDSIPEKFIIDQHPEAEKEVKKKRTIYYVISKGSKIVLIPDLRGKNLRQAQLTLKSMGLLSGKIRYEFDDSIAPDCIMYTEPEKGVTSSRGTSVNLFVSQGGEPEEVVVPNLVGLPLSDALESIEKSALTKGSIAFQVKKELFSETIISQSLSPGKKVQRKTAINIIVSTQE